MKKVLIRKPAIDKTKNSITWIIDNLETGKIKTFGFKAKIGNDFEHMENFKNIVQVEYDGKIQNESVIEDKVLGYPNFSESTNSVVDIDGGSVWAGDSLKYTVVVKNTGLRPGEDFTLVCPIPGYTSYNSGSASPSDTASYDADKNALIWQIPELGVGEEKIFEFNVNISSSLTGGGNIQNAFYVEGDDQYVEIEPTSIGVRSYIFQTVVCMGDSEIVYTNWPATLDYLLESSYARAEYNTIGSGVPQERAYQGARRFDSTVAIYSPQVIIIGYGTNDVGGGTDLLRNGLNDLINKAKSIGATVIVHSIGFIDTNIQPAKKGVSYYNDTIRSVCAQQGVPYVDIYGPMSRDPRRFVGSDGIHWTAEGGNLVANLVFGTLRNYLDAEGKRK